MTLHARARRRPLMIVPVALLASAGLLAPAHAAPPAGWEVQRTQDQTPVALLHDVVAFSEADAWAVGLTTRMVDDSQQGLVRHWDGETWTDVPTAPSRTNAGFVGVGGSAPDDVWAVGSALAPDNQFGELTTLIQHWDGQAWSVVDSPNGDPSIPNGTFAAVDATSATDAWAVGSYAPGLQERAEPLLAHWDGTAWTAVPGPELPPGHNTLVDVAARTGSDAWAVGSRTDEAAMSLPLMLRWDGTTWFSVTLPDVGEGSLRSVTAVSADDVWAVGTADGATLALHYDGVAWTSVETVHSGSSSILDALDVTGTGQLLAAGTVIDEQSGLPRTLVQRWNGRRWHVVATPNAGEIDNQLRGLAVAGDAVFAVGSYLTGSDPTLEQTLLLHGHTRALGLPGYLAWRRPLLGVGDLTGGGQ